MAIPNSRTIDLGISLWIGKALSTTKTREQKTVRNANGGAFYSSSHLCPFEGPESQTHRLIELEGIFTPPPLPPEKYGHPFHNQDPLHNGDTVTDYSTVQNCCLRL